MIEDMFDCKKVWVVDGRQWAEVGDVINVLGVYKMTDGSINYVYCSVETGVDDEDWLARSEYEVDSLITGTIKSKGGIEIKEEM